jgi:hypothetical protein
MPFFQNLMTKIQTHCAAIANFFRGLAGKCAPLELWGKLSDCVRGALQKIPAEKRRLFFIGAGGGLVLVLLICVAAVAMQKPPAADIPSRANVPVRPVLIPPEELFLPDEPDFIPGVLLGRERRLQWTPEDMTPHWQDPLKNGEERWRNSLELAIDELLERVP